MKLLSLVEALFPEIEKQFEKEELAEFAKHDFAMLAEYHFGLGTWIRNHFLYGDTALAKEFEAVGIKHPDDMSGFIIEMFHTHCNSKNFSP